MTVTGPRFDGKWGPASPHPATTNPIFDAGETSLPPPPQPVQVISAPQDDEADVLQGLYNKWYARLKRIWGNVGEERLQDAAMDRACKKLESLNASQAAPPPPQVVTVQPPQAAPQPPRDAFDLYVLERHLPAKERKSLLSQITQLAANHLPEPADLGPFWLQVEEAVRSLHASLLDLSVLRRPHVRQLAPVVLGARGWAHFQHSSWGSWREF